MTFSSHRPAPSPEAYPVQPFDHEDWTIRTVRPLGASAIYSLVPLGNFLLAVDRLRGFLLQIDPATDNTTIVNPETTAVLVNATGLSIWEDTLWFTRDQGVYCCPGAIQAGTIRSLQPQLFIRLPFRADGVAVWQSTIYVTCVEAGAILVFNRQAQEITRFYAPGVGQENLTVWEEELWVCDQTEQTVYCLERGTGEVKFSVLTPFESPCGLTWYQHPQTGKKLLYVAYSSDELYIFDNPNSEPQYQLAKRDRTFIHPLHCHYYASEKYATSYGYLVEMSYVEEIEPL
ncbi:MAG: transglutaminase, partial [Microcoleaceae cyanobacterium]